MYRLLLHRLRDALLLNLGVVFGYHAVTLACRALEMRYVKKIYGPDTAQKIDEFIRAFTYD